MWINTKCVSYEDTIPASPFDDPNEQSCKGIFAVTLIKTAAVFVIIGVCYVTGIV